MNKTTQWIEWLTSEDLKKWKKATLGLGGLKENSDIDIESLITALETDDERILFWVIGALGRIAKRSIAAVERLIQLTNHASLSVRQSSVMALARIAPDDVRITEVLISKLEDESEFVRCNVLHSLIKMEFINDNDINAIKLMLTDKNHFVVHHAETALRHLKNRAEKT